VAEAFQKFYTATLNPYLNFHRSCGFATLVESKRGRIRRIYKHSDYRAPYEKLRMLPDWKKTLKTGSSAAPLPLHPFPGSHNFKKGQKTPRALRLALQAHAAVERHPFLGLIPHWNQNLPPGSFPDWKMLVTFDCWVFC
jgi:hypothetical protein